MKRYLNLFIISLFFVTYPTIGTTSKSNFVIENANDRIKNYQFSQAIEILTAEIDRGNQNEQIYFLLGEALRLTVFFARYGEFTEIERATMIRHSEDAYEKSLDMKPEYFESRLGLGKLYHMGNEYEKALEQYKIIESQKKEDFPDLYKEMGDVYLEMNKYKMAKKSYLQGGFGTKANFDKGKVYILPIHTEYRIDDKIVKANSEIAWIVHDPVIFSAQMVNKKMAESRIKDIYYAALLISFPVRENGPKELNHRKIKKMCNSKLIRFGIQIDKINSIELET